MRILGLVVFLVSNLWMVSTIAEDAIKLREEILVPVEYQGRQIQLTGWFEKPATSGAFPVVIVLHEQRSERGRLWGAGRCHIGR